MPIDFEEFGLNPIKTISSSIKELYRLPDEKLEAIKLHLIKEAFSYHYEKNEFYRNACKEKDVTPEDIQAFGDLIKIPLVPIRLHKSSDSHQLLLVPLNEIELELRSTGVSGVPSVARRCEDSINNALLIAIMMFREFLELIHGAGLLLFPSSEEVPEMGMSRPLNLLAVLMDASRFAVKETAFSSEDAVDQLSEWKNKFKRHIIGAPFLIKQFIEYLKGAGIKLKLDKGSYVMTIGGWKRFTGEMMLREEFDKECMEYLGVEKGRIRDTYGLAETNAFAIEDEFGEKHIPPPIHFSVRDPKQLDKELEPGEFGQLAIFDPTMRSTPGSLLTEDVVRLLPGKSRSGRNGQRMEYVDRAPDAEEFSCCAVNLERVMSGEETCASAACPVV